ncbi:guanine nucleotide exchange factor [Ophiostoma piceae UAMH 11346]|uniref:Guanine nucleotide exchange factor n=1 Tax=Ophiostoma piceae (strain UAMH 11346) TaxID=1262450 RepID=S3C6D8_OPHP1|nr:guanine nucleotide exchange factor [Ophiostoma piceae UAMH 11346]
MVAEPSTMALPETESAATAGDSASSPKGVTTTMTADTDTTGTDTADTETATPAPYDPFADPEGDAPSDTEQPPIDASVATLKPSTSTSTPSISTPSASTANRPAALSFLTPNSSSSASASASAYIDPTPATPLTSNPPSRSPSNAASQSRSVASSSPAPSDDDKRYLSDESSSRKDKDKRAPSASRSEIQSIMEQFSGDGGGPGAEEVMSPRLENMASPLLGAPMHHPSQASLSQSQMPSHPPRKSSLEPLAPTIAQQIAETAEAADAAEAAGAADVPAQDSPQSSNEPDDKGPPVPPKDKDDAEIQSIHTPLSPTVSLHRPPPPEPEPEPVLAFDFHRFLEQLRNKKADPVARYLKSFLSEFGKRQWMVHEQVKIISDFLTFIANKMAVCEVWRDLSDAEFDNAREGMEKLVMNRLYTQTFSPAIPPPQPIPGAKPKRRGGERPMGPGRRGQHQEDVERDEILSQKINIYAWIREPHLDIPPIGGDSGRRFLKLAQQELLKIKSYRAPRDKIICVLNCCKVIFGLLKHNKADSSADSFMPLLIYVVLQSNPDHLVSNVQYILRFRNQDKLGGEAGYYLSSLLGAVQFVENMDRTTLTITDEEFERNVEAAVSAIAEKHRAASPPLPVPPEDSPTSSKPDENQPVAPPQDAGAAASNPLVEALPPPPPPPQTQTQLSPDGEDKDAITGLLRTIQRPLSTIGRMFSEDPTQAQAQAQAQSSPQARGRSPQSRDERRRPVDIDGVEGVEEASTRPPMPAEEAAARQASAEAAEAQRLHRVEHASIVETLAGMFPDLDRDIISDVVYQKEGRVGLAVDACLALSS